MTRSSFLCCIQSQSPGGVLWEQSREGESPPSTCWPNYFSCRSGYRWLSEMQVHIASSCPFFFTTRNYKSFFAGLLSICSSHSLYYYCILPWSWCSTLHFSMLNFMSIAQAHSSNLSRSLWILSLPSSPSVIPHSLGSANSLRVPWLHYITTVNIN